MSKSQAVRKIKEMREMRASLKDGEIKVTCKANGVSYFATDAEDAVKTARLMQREALYGGRLGGPVGHRVMPCLMRP